MSIIFIAGAPGCGKSTVAALLHKKLKCPYFEFGWIPEFRNLNPYLEISYEQEEKLSFESLMLVAQNYLRHGYEHVILTDIRYEFLGELQKCFGQQMDTVILYCDSDDVICQRILNRNNGNEYRDTQAACRINAQIKADMQKVDAFWIASDMVTPEKIADKIVAVLGLDPTIKNTGTRSAQSTTKHEK